MKRRHTAIVSAQSETQINLGANSVLFRHEEGILGRFEAGCLPERIQLAPGLSGPSFNIDAGSFAVTREGEGNFPGFWVGMCPGRTKKWVHNPGKIFLEKTPKTFKHDKILLISLDLSHNPCKNFKFYSLQRQNI